MPGPTVSGFAVLTTVSGAVLVTSGLRGITVAETLRAIVRGEPLGALAGPNTPDATPGKAAQALSGTSMGELAASYAQSYIGVPYVWAGEDPKGWDCSGFVTWVLHHDLGLQLPSNFHTVAAQFYVWSGAQSIPRRACAAGDLVCWPSHVGMAVSATDMVHAPGPGQRTKISRIWSVPSPVIRRPKAYG